MILALFCDKKPSPSCGCSKKSNSAIIDDKTASPKNSNCSLFFFLSNDL
jgi:hypothetical protein